MPVKQTIAIIALVGISFYSYGQKKHVLELRVGAGAITAPDIMEGIGTAVTDAIITDNFQTVDANGESTWMATVLIFPESRFTVGLDVIANQTDLTFQYDNAIPDQHSSANYLSFMGRLDVKYIKKGMVRLYSSIGAGVCSRSAERTDNGVESTNQSTGACLQITPLGIRVGQKIAVWGEVGFGFRGIICGGLAFSL